MLKSTITNYGKNLHLNTLSESTKCKQDQQRTKIKNKACQD